MINTYLTSFRYVKSLQLKYYRLIKSHIRNLKVPFVSMSMYINKPLKDITLQSIITL